MSTPTITLGGMMNERKSTTDPRMVCGVYRSGYWGQTYVVHAMSGGTLTVRWEDGRITTHATAWDARRDTIVSQPGE